MLHITLVNPKAGIKPVKHNTSHKRAATVQHALFATAKVEKVSRKKK